MPISLRIAPQVDLFRAWLNTKREEWPEVSRQIATSVVDFMKAETQANIKSDDLMFRPSLHGSISTLVTYDAHGPAGGTATGRVYSELVHAAVMEDGRRPHPELKGKWFMALVPWVVKKIPYEPGGDKGFAKFLRLPGSAKKGGRSQKSQSAISRAQRDAMSTAYAIALSIDRKGIKGRHFLARAVAKAKIRLPEIANRIVAEWARRGS